MEPNFTAMHALWADTHARFAIDDSRVYAAGYSGTVRFACILALTAPGTIAGIIGAGAGFPFGSTPKGFFASTLPLDFGLVAAPPPPPLVAHAPRTDEPPAAAGFPAEGRWRHRSRPGVRP